MFWIGDQTRLKSAAYQRSWFASKAMAGGGKLLIHGIHYIDTIQFIAGERIQEVCGLVANVGGQPIEVEDAAVVSMRLASGMLATLNTGYYLDRGFQNLIVVWGSEGWLRFDQPAGTPLEWYSTRDGAPRGLQSFRYSNEPDKYALTVQAAIDAARGLREPPMTGAECLHVLRVVFAAYAAAEAGSRRKVI
jgi:predicted dehydrogenase